MFGSKFRIKADKERATVLTMDTNDRLLRHLQEKNQVVLVSKIFAALKSNVKRVDFAYDLLQENKLFPEFTIDGKNDKKSAELRRQGNYMFKKRRSREALEFYTNSLAHAEHGSENFALAFANRSAVLFENQLYQECLLEINQALRNNCPENIKQKLINRMIKAKDLLPKQYPIRFFTPIPSIAEEEKNPLIQCASNSIKIKISKNEGRHIVATRDIGPGEVIAIENPFCQILIEQFYTHCHHCLKLNYNLIPCLKCTQSLYCGESCKSEAEIYHTFECPILLILRKLNMDKLKLLPMKIALLVKDEYGLLTKCTLNEEDMYRSDRYDEIHNLVANTDSRSVSDLFNRAVTAAVIFFAIKNYTDFFEDKADTSVQDKFKELVLFHMQTGPCNFHEITEIKSSDHSLEQQEIAAGAYSFLSMFNHSCCPNVIRYCYGSTAIVVTIESIKMGEQCFDNYGYHHAVMERADRQAKLKKQYFFSCVCKACLQDYPLYSNLTLVENPEKVISTSDLKLLQENNLEETKTILQKTNDRIKELEKLKPNKNLAELQEVLKQCFFIFRTINTPI